MGLFFVISAIILSMQKHKKHTLSSYILLALIFVIPYSMSVDDICFYIERQRYYDLISANSIYAESLVNDVNLQIYMEENKGPKQSNLFLAKEVLPENSRPIAILSFYQDSKKIDTVLFSVVDIQCGCSCIPLDENTFGIFSSLTTITKGYCYQFPEFFSVKCLNIISQLDG